MASIIDILSGSEPDAREVADATTAALRRRQLMAEMGATVPAFAPSAKIAGQDIGNQGKMLEAAGVGRLHYGQEAQALKLAMEREKNQAAINRALIGRDTALEVQRLKNMMAQAAAGKGQIVLGPDGNFVIVNKTTGTSAPVTAPPSPEGGSASPLRQGRPIEPDVQKMAADAQFLSTMPEDLALLKKYVNKDRPGGGPLAGRLPDWMLPQEANAQRQASMRLINSLIYMSTGKQINETEAERILMARGIGPKASQAAYNAGVPALEREIKKAAGIYKAKYRPEVVSTVRERHGLDWLDKFAPSEAPSDAGKVLKWNPDKGVAE